jgi:hypothetical protein
MLVDRGDELVDGGRAEIDDRPHPPVGQTRRHASAIRQLEELERRVVERRLRVAGFFAAGAGPVPFVAAVVSAAAGLVPPAVPAAGFRPRVPREDEAAPDAALEDDRDVVAAGLARDRVFGAAALARVRGFGAVAGVAAGADAAAAAGLAADAVRRPDVDDDLDDARDRPDVARGLLDPVRRRPRDVADFDAAGSAVAALDWSDLMPWTSAASSATSADTSARRAVRLSRFLFVALSRRPRRRPSSSRAAASAYSSHSRWRASAAAGVITVGSGVAMGPPFWGSDRRIIGVSRGEMIPDPR